MGRILAIDYGEKRTGIAVTDENQIIANGLKTVQTKDLFSFLEAYISSENVESIVIGEPKQMNYRESESAVHIEKFMKKIKSIFTEINIERYDERFTSKMAFQTMIDAGLKKKDRRNKELVDTISATIILQSYMESKKKFK